MKVGLSKRKKMVLEKSGSLSRSCDGSNGTAPKSFTVVLAVGEAYKATF